MSSSVYQISDFRGGESEEAKRGLRGSFKVGKNLNIHKKGENNLSCNQKLKKISTEISPHQVVDLIIKIVPVSATKFYGFGDAGNVYRIEGEVVTLIYTDPDAVILDAEFFYDYLYWTTKTHLKRHLEATVAWADGDCAAITEDAGTFLECDYHPLYHVPKSDLLCVGNERYVSNVSAANYFNAEALDLFWGWTVKTLNIKKPLLLIGATKWGRAELFTWDLSSVSYDPLEGWIEEDINAILETTDGARYIFSPEMLYWFKQGLSIKVRELPSQVKSGAIDIHRSRIHFGASKGVYSWASVSKNYPDVLNLEYTISTGSESGVDIGAILGIDDDLLLVGWFDDSQAAGSKYGLDIVDPAYKADAVYEGLIFDAERPHTDKLFRAIKLLTKSLPKGCSVKVKYRMDGIDDWVETKMEDDNEAFDKGDYTTGTIAIQVGSTTIKGTSTIWTDAMAGRKIKVDSDGKVYAIQTVVSNTEITLKRAYTGVTASGESYTILGATKAIFTIEGQGEVYEVRIELYSSGNLTPDVRYILSYFKDDLNIL